jgi:hypothetical protein
MHNLVLGRSKQIGGVLGSHFLSFKFLKIKFPTWLGFGIGRDLGLYFDCQVF